MPNYNKIFHIVLIGDSITQLSDKNGGFSALLRNQYATQAMITNIALSGGNTGTGKTHLQYKDVKQFLPHHISKAIICVGANDDMYGIEKPKELPKRRMGVSKEQFAQLYETMYDEFSKYTKDIVFVATPPIAPNYNWDRLHEQTEEYADVVKELGKKLNVTVLDIRSKTKVTDVIWKDGLHFNDQGNKLMAELISENIGKLPKFRRDWQDFVECRDVNSFYDKSTDKCQCKKTFVLINGECGCQSGYVYDEEKDECVFQTLHKKQQEGVTLQLAVFAIAICCILSFTIVILTVTIRNKLIIKKIKQNEEDEVLIVK